MFINIQKKPILVFEIISFVAGVTIAFFIYYNTILPYKEYISSSNRILSDISAINRNLKKINHYSHIIYLDYELKPKRYKQSAKNYIKKLKIIVKDTNNKYADALSEKQNSLFNYHLSNSTAGYSIGLKKTANFSIGKQLLISYRHYKYIYLPLLKRFIKYPTLFQSRFNKQIFFSYLDSFSALPTAKIITQASIEGKKLSRFADIFFETGSVVLLALFIIFSYFSNKFIKVLNDTKEELKITSFAFEVNEAIVITNADNKIIKVNHTFEKYTGYSKKEAIGQTPAILKSGRHDADFYRKMWDKILKDGYWEGEIWNKRKNGEIYPEWLHIDAMRDNKGHITHYVANFRDITKRKAQEEELLFIAYHDILTTLPNRRALEEELDKSVVRAERFKRFLAVIMMDLDGFKQINDTYGHEAGDTLLKIIGKRLNNGLRRTDFIARMGGDEFVILVEDLLKMDEIDEFLLKVESMIKSPIEVSKGNTVKIGVSAGVCFYKSENEENPDALLRYADIALYESKKHKSDRVKYWSIYN